MKPLAWALVGVVVCALSRQDAAKFPETSKRPTRGPAPSTSARPSDEDSRTVPYWKSKRTNLVAVGFLLSALISMWLWNHAQPNEAIPRANGGIHLFLEEDAAADEVAADEVMVAVDARISKTGFDGTSLLRIDAEFSEAEPGRRWFLVASGQFQLHEEMNDAAFCSGPGYPSRSRTVLSCPSDPGWGNATDVEYRFDDGIGARAFDSHGILRLSDYDGYDHESSSVVTGRFGNDDKASLVFWLPIRDLVRARLGPEDFVRVPQLFSRDSGDFGALEPVGVLREAPATRAGVLASLSSGVVLSSVSTLRASLEIVEDFHGGRLVSARPDTVAQGNLYWEVRRGGLPGIEYSIYDPVAATRQSGWTFLAGILAALSMSLLVYLIGTHQVSLD
jgi:hypothetical protein